MITREEYLGGAQQVSFGSNELVLPWSGRLIAATATTTGLFFVLPLLTHAWLQTRVGEGVCTIWNEGTNSFTVLASDGPAYSQVLTADQVLKLSTRKTAAGAVRWIGILRERKT